MKTVMILALAAGVATVVSARPGDPQPQARDSLVALPELLREAVLVNPDIAAARAGIDAARGRSRQAGTLMDPELMYRREQMPGFRWNEAMMEKLELMQMVPFPAKLSRESAAARFTLSSSEYGYAEAVNGVLAQVSVAYVALWYARESLELNDENAALLTRFLEASRTKYAVGAVGMQDVLRASIELSMVRNERADFEAASDAAGAEILGLLDRRDTLFAADVALPDMPEILPPADALEALAMNARPMLRRDSLLAEAGRAMTEAARAGYLPDLRIGVMYMTAPAGDFRGWGVSAGISIPFAPWSLGRIAGKVEEQEAAERQARARYASAAAMTRAGVRELRAMADAELRQLEVYHREILPDAGRALTVGLTAYQTGGTDILSLLDTFRTYVRLRQEALKKRLRFEQTRIELERTVGLLAARTLAAERILP